MKKIISLTILIGLLATFFIIVIFYAPASKAASTNSFTAVNKTKPRQAGPDWFNPAWHYRRRVVIINNGAPLDWYQVLIKLDTNNFDFSHAAADGSDIRLTYADGTTELKYWIESWDSIHQLAYVWVRVPNLGNGNSSIYVYYHNPEAISVGDGVSTFDRFDDDWAQFINGGFYQDNVSQLFQSPQEVSSPFDWSTISGTPTELSGILNLNDGDGIKSNSTSQYNAVGIRANFGLGSGYEWGGFINEADGQRAVIGELYTDPGNLYLIDYRTAYENVLLPRVGGNDWHNDYHIYEVRWNSGESKADIDHGLITVGSSQPLQVPNTSLPVTLYSYAGSNAALKVDWVYVRQYREPEPTFSVGGEQGLVELSINDTDSPDPIRKGEQLTYQLTISNSSTISAMSVIVTDTLPASVQVGPISSSQGSCVPGSVILCDLNIIYANSTANITIIVTPTVDGEISNIAAVGSPGYELDLSDNSSEQETLVDSAPPVVNWEQPAKNGQLYISGGGSITLEASATDNDQVAWVEFRLWDHIHIKWISIGTDTTYPYQVPFNSDSLEVNQIYQMFVIAGDRAGNQSDPYNPLQVIYIERRLPVYLPFLKK